MLPLAIDPRDATPLYAQLERGIRVAIATGRLAAGTQLPTVRQLAVELRVNANTVAKVYLSLEREGVVVTKRGVGTFVAESQPQPAQAKSATHVEKQLKSAADRYLSDTAAAGLTPSQAVRYLEGRVREGE